MPGSASRRDVAVCLRHYFVSEIRELAEDLTEFLPGLGAEGYELLHTALVLPSFIEAVADGTVNVDDEAYWRTGLKPSISQEDA